VSLRHTEGVRAVTEHDPEVGKTDIDEGLRADGLSSKERKELRELRRENKQLKLEREILGKAAAWFARESITLPKPTDS
jgi:transposase